MRTIKQFFRRLKRTIDFLPIIWKGFDFDYRYAIELFQYQLERTADFMESDRAYTVDAEKRAIRIRTAVKLMKKVYEEDYACEYQDKLKELYGETVLNMKFEPTEYNNDTSYLKWEFEYWDNAEEIKRVHDGLFKLSQQKQLKAERILWKFIEHNIRGWWD